MPEHRENSVHLHTHLYTEEAIRAAAETFADFASFAVHRENEHFVVDIRDIDPGIDGDVIGEFCNFALANTATSRQE